MACTWSSLISRPAPRKPALMIRMKVRGGDPEELDEDGDGVPDSEEEDDESSAPAQD